MTQRRVFIYSMMCCAVVVSGAYMLCYPYNPSARARAEGEGGFYMLALAGFYVLCFPFAVGISAIVAYCLGRR